jgi:hypothetical protein
MDEKLIELLYANFGIWAVLLVTVVLLFWRLGAELTKLRQEVAYEVNRDLLAKRFEAYGALWAKMEPFAIYADAAFDRAEAGKLEHELSEWYFSANGGLLLTAEARDFYFALQNTLRAASRSADWSCQHRPVDTLARFNTLLHTCRGQNDRLTECARLIAEKRPQDLNPGDWLAACDIVAKELAALAEQRTPQACENIYSALQQISSILRTRLAAEVRSRLAVNLPR